ncbi:MAG: ShlB/FhaC/HecB family hemolysin secretion/activation protein [Phycisphaerales bacterium JB043]
MSNARQTTNRFGAWIGALSLALVSAPALAQDSPADASEELAEPVLVELLESDGAPHTITQIIVEYLHEVDGQPSEEEVLNTYLTLAQTSEGYVAPREGQPVQHVPLNDLHNLENPVFYDSALVSLAPAIVARLQALGLLGVYVEPDPSELFVVDNQIRDAREAGNTTLTMQITTGSVVEVRSNALGERVKDEDTINHRFHQRIRDNSPVRATANISEENEEGHTALLDRRKLDNYVYLMNRHPGRRVDVALVPEGSVFGGVSLDYLITENNPLMFYAQLANTGTDATSELQERFGLIHNQLTNNDDIFAIDYLTGNFDEVHALNASYDVRLFDNDRIRGRVYGSLYEYTAAEFGQVPASFEGDGYSIGGEIRFVLHQDRDYFVDAFGGLRFDTANVDNQLTLTSGEGEFLIPSAGLRGELYRQQERLYWSVWAQGNVLDNDQSDLVALGRTGSDEQWVSLHHNASYSFYLEPLLTKSENEPTALAHEIALSTRGQWSGDHRLPPNYLQVAGGLTTVRGYPQAVVSGDDAIVGTIEYRYHIPQGLAPDAQPGYLFGKPFRYAPQYVSGPTDWDLIFKTFLDVGYVDRSDATALETDNTLLGAGVGLDLEITRRVRGEVNFGWALHEVSDAANNILADDGDFEVQFIVTLIF